MINKALDKQYTAKIFSFFFGKKSNVLTIIAIALIVDILFVPSRSDFVIFGLLTFYIVSIWFYNVKSRLTFLLCLLILGIMFVEFLFFGPSPKAEKAAVWLFFFLGIGIIQQWKE